MLIHAGLNLKSIALLLIIATGGYFAGTTIFGGDKQQGTAEEISTDQSGLLTMEQLVELVGPIALYPDELLAIVIPASTYPMEIVQASRFLQQYKNKPDLKPDEQWDPSVLGLLNYPEVVELMNNDLDWTWKLGEAVVNQQNDVMEAIQQFRDKAQEAGNLESNDKQVIVVEKEVIKIESASPEVIYVPSYTPSTVVVYQTTPYPYYYSAPYPYYYRPAAIFWTGVFVGSAITYGIHWGNHVAGMDEDVLILISIVGVTLLTSVVVIPGNREVETVQGTDLAQEYVRGQEQDRELERNQVQQYVQGQEQDQGLERNQVQRYVQGQEQDQGLARNQVQLYVQGQEQDQGLARNQIQLYVQGQEPDQVQGKGHPPNSVIKGPSLPQRGNLNAHGVVVEVPLVVTITGRLRPETVSVVR